MQLADLEIRVSRSENLPALPEVLGHALRLADDPDLTQRDLERLIEREPAIAAKVLRVANSAYYGGPGATTLPRAISLLGANMMRSLIISVAFQQAITSRESSREFNRVELWRHSLATATAARILARLRMPSQTDELFVAALLHDVGILVLERFAPAELDLCLRHARAEKMALHDAEQMRFGWDHSDVGGLLADKWGLVSTVKHAILFHHNPLMDGEYYETTCFVAAANVLAYQCGYTNNQQCAGQEIDPTVAEAIGLPIEQFDAIREVVIEEVQRMEQVFGIQPVGHAA